MHSIRRLIAQRATAITSSAITYGRNATSRFRPPPDFMIIGAQRSGTTSLFYYLSQHPQILPSFTKEVHFFDGGLNPEIDNFKKGLRWYRGHFRLKIFCTTDCVAGEASPLYIYNPLAPLRIKQHIENVKLIAVLRNPTERAISHYFHEVKKRREWLPPLQAFQEEERRMNEVMTGNDYKSNAFIHFSYKKRGLYKEQLERYLRYFCREQLLILNSEVLFQDPQKFLRTVFDFLEVDRTHKISDLAPLNTGRKASVEPEVHQYLNRFFVPHNQELYQLLGHDFGW